MHGIVRTCSILVTNQELPVSNVKDLQTACDCNSGELYIHLLAPSLPLPLVETSSLDYSYSF